MLIPKDPDAPPRVKGQTGYIYAITNLINGKRYIGQTSQTLAMRWSQHKSALNKGVDNPLYRAIRKYGIENFSLMVVSTLISSTELNGHMNALEIYHIKQADCVVPMGYNLQRGGNNQPCHPETAAKISAKLKGHPVSMETRAKLAITSKGKRYNVGRPVPLERGLRISRKLKGRGRDKIFSSETRAKISAGLRGRFVSDETRAKISASKKGKPGNMKGYKHTPESRAKMSTSHTGISVNKGRKHSEQSRLNMSLAHQGKKQSAETIAKRAISFKATIEARKMNA